MDDTQYVYFAGKHIETTVTHRASTICSWISNVRSSYSRFQELIVGLDIEWRPNTRRRMNNPAATLQLCVGTKCIIIQLVYLDYIPEDLNEFLEGEDVVLVGVEIERDVAKLQEDYGLNCGNVVDVRDVAMERYYFENNRPGLKEIAAEVVGLDIPKPIYVTRSDWQVRVLDEDQIEYACLDAYASFRIGLAVL